MTPDTYNFFTDPVTGEVRPQRRGNSFNGMTFTILVNSVPVSFVGASAKLHVKRASEDSPVLEWNSDDGSITFAGNVITLQPKTGAQMNVEPGVYIYDLLVLHSNGVSNTYVSGTFEIVNRVTKWTTQ